MDSIHSFLGYRFIDLDPEDGDSERDSDGERDDLSGSERSTSSSASSDTFCVLPFDGPDGPHPFYDWALLPGRRHRMRPKKRRPGLHVLLPPEKPSQLVIRVEDKMERFIRDQREWKANDEVNRHCQTVVPKHHPILSNLPTPYELAVIDELRVVVSPRNADQLLIALKQSTRLRYLEITCLRDESISTLSSENPTTFSLTLKDLREIRFLHPSRQLESTVEKILVSAFRLDTFRVKSSSETNPDTMVRLAKTLSHLPDLRHLEWIDVEAGVTRLIAGKGSFERLQVLAFSVSFPSHEKIFVSPR